MLKQKRRLQKRMVFGLLLLLLADSLAGCGMLEKVNNAVEDFSNEHDGDIMQVFDDLKNAEHQGGPFENNLESARSYLLEQMKEKYGIEFTVIGNEELENYGPFAGATYTCEVAPADEPEQVTTALVSQTAYQNVRDNYAVYFFKEMAEIPVLEFCGTKDYVLDQRISLEMPETAYRWTADDRLERYLSQSGAYVRVTLYFDDSLDTRTYAEQILDFLNSIDQLNCNLFIQARAKDTYICFSEAQVLDDFDASSYTIEEIEKIVAHRLKTGDPK